MKLLPLCIALLFSTPLAALAEAAIAGIGTVTDPSGACRMEGNAERLTMALPAGDHALAAEQNRMGAPRILREISGDFTAQVTVSGSYPQDAATEVAQRRPFQGAGLLLWVDAGTYIRLERAQIKVEDQGAILHVLYPGWELRIESKPLRLASGEDGVLSAPATHLRLSRTGNKVEGSISEDGKTWRALDPLTLKLPDKVQIGVVAGHNTTSPFEAIFTNFELKPAVVAVP